MYKTVVIGYLPKADDMAQKVEGKARHVEKNSEVDKFNASWYDCISN